MRGRAAAAVLIVAGLVAACSGDGGSDAPAEMSADFDGQSVRTDILTVTPHSGDVAKITFRLPFTRGSVFRVQRWAGGDWVDEWQMVPTFKPEDAPEPVDLAGGEDDAADGASDSGRGPSFVRLPELDDGGVYRICISGVDPNPDTAACLRLDSTP